MPKSFICSLLACLLPACSYCWPSLHTADAVLHCDKQVVVYASTRPTFKYKYQGEDYYPVTLAYAIDKGKSIYRRGDGAPWCLQDSSERFVVQEDTKRQYLYRLSRSSASPELIPEERFPMTAATREQTAEDAWYPLWHGFALLYGEVPWEVEGMPLTQTPEQPSLWREVVAFPLGLVDVTASIAMTTAEAAGIIAILPVAAVWSGITKIVSESKS